jgi:hypothetical protein
MFRLSTGIASGQDDREGRDQDGLRPALDDARDAGDAPVRPRLAGPARPRHPQAVDPVADLRQECRHERHGGDDGDGHGDRGAVAHLRDERDPDEREARDGDRDDRERHGQRHRDGGAEHDQQHDDRGGESERLAGVRVHGLRADDGAAELDLHVAVADGGADVVLDRLDLRVLELAGGPIELRAESPARSGSARWGGRPPPVNPRRGWCCC